MRTRCGHWRSVCEIPYTIASASYEQGQLAAVRGDWEAARRRLQWGLDAGSPDTRIASLLARIAYAVGEVDVARGQQQRLLESRSGRAARDRASSTPTWR